MATLVKTNITEEKIITWYMDSVLENGKVPESVYKFCKANKIGEDTFYGFFGSFESIQQRIWHKFFDNTTALLNKNKDYATMSNEDKMLTFFFTFFENLTLNRSYVLFALKEHRNAFEGLAQLKGLRKSFKEFATELIHIRNEEKNLKILKYNEPLFSEGAWLQFLFLLKFWMEDSSPGFEKTDIAIEKSVTTIFQIFENTPLEKIIDFGKFLYKEKFV
ncbi:TetR family transcriptional regulator C-terminal domain-containing protein [Flagellimonas aequoris]|uniref:TetR/AcrR family transcriptional regulator n=1 Tax=Flagellimonas aequoris TaxID=2306997 RepID=A0A418N2N5_9FLAO|nr:TetR family transcriptional regulator C-terminal domain-containing protein [Allomuricauda aequoris]RIV67576.1 TetR/AcrR family transcriptional regulator [Allomuricauda aequoris]TXJ99401.1 TetR/AcrR family transcriptional regulator [Allomuricauda aequoris]